MKYYIEKNMSSDIMSIHHGPQKKIVLKLVLWIIRSFQPKITNSKKSVCYLHLNYKQKRVLSP